MTEDPNEAQVRVLIEHWLAAVRRGDLRAVLAHHSGDVVLFDVVPPARQVGLESYEKAWRLFFSYQARGGFELHDLHVATGDRVAFAHGRLRIGDDAPFEVRLTLGFEKVDGHWLFTHEHHSAPSPPES